MVSTSILDRMSLMTIAQSSYCYQLEITSYRDQPHTTQFTEATFPYDI